MIHKSEDFSQFFTSKIEKIREGLESLQTAAEAVSDLQHPNLETELNAFQPVSAAIVEKIINKAPVKSCCQDPIPKTLLKSCLALLLPIITHIVNLSLQSATVPSVFKQACM